MLIKFSDVVKTYGSGEAMQTAVDHVDFTIDEGEFVVILGQSGAGKSTVLNMLGGMDIPRTINSLENTVEIQSGLSFSFITLFRVLLQWKILL